MGLDLDKRLKDVFASEKSKLEKKVDGVKNKIDDKIDTLKDSGKASFENTKSRVEDRIFDARDDAKNKLRDIEDKAKDKIDDLNSDARKRIDEVKLNVAKKLLGSMIGGNMNDIAKKLALIATTLNLKSLMKNVPTMLYRILWNIPSNMKDDIRKIGDHIQFLTPIVVVLYCIIDGNIPMLREFIIYYLICTVIQILLKWAFNAPRPSQTDSEANPFPKLEWSVNRGDSFPSGHTMSAISGGLFWTLFAFGQPWVGIAGITLGLITALSRMIVRAHWLLDVGTSIIIASIVFLIMI
jgi:hypothetical protein